MKPLLLVALGGAVGSVSRYGVGELAKATFGPDFGWGTLAVNVLGCLLLGGLFQVGRDWAPGDPTWLALGVGFMGGFTTFSSFGLDAWTYIDADRWVALTGYLVGNVVVGIAAVAAGVAIARAFAA